MKVSQIFKKKIKFDKITAGGGDLAWPDISLSQLETCQKLGLEQTPNVKLFKTYNYHPSVKSLDQIFLFFLSLFLSFCVL